MNMRFRVLFKASIAAIAVLILAALAASQEIKLVDLKVKGLEQSKAIDVNNKGQVVGWMINFVVYPTWTQHVFLINPRDTNGNGKPDLWVEDLDGDSFNDLAVDLTPGETQCEPIKINEAGHVLLKRVVGGVRWVFCVITPIDLSGDGVPDTWCQIDSGTGKNSLMVDIPSLGGSDYLWAATINNRGQVVGTSSPPGSWTHPFLWSASTGTIDLGVFGPDEEGFAADINDQGEIVGWCWGRGPAGAVKAFKLTPLDADLDHIPDCWFQDADQNGVNDCLGGLESPGGEETKALAINERGTVLGEYWNADNSFPIIWPESGSPLPIAGIGSVWHLVNTINDHDQIIGQAEVPVDPWDVYPFFWSEETGFLNLGFTEGRDDSAWDINNKGQVVCSYECYNQPFGPGKAHSRAGNWGYLWSQESGRVDLASLDGQTDACNPVSISDMGIVAGASGSAIRRTNACLWILNNTGTGANVSVTPVDPVTGESPVTITFGEVTEAGETTVSVLPTGTPPPDGFKLGTPPHYYMIETTAAYSGPVTICINYEGIKFGPNEKPQLFHHASGHWEKIESAVNEAAQTICGQVASLSEFALFGLDVEAEGLLPPMADLGPLGSDVSFPNVAFKLGRTLPLRLRLFSAGTLLTGADVMPPKIISLIRGGSAIVLETLDLDAGEANDTGSLFRFDDGLWAYNLSTKGLQKGTYTLIIELPDGDRLCTGFILR